MLEAYLDEEVKIFLTCVYAIGAIVSIWASIFSADIFGWMGMKMNKKYTNVRDWPKRFLVSLLIQPVTFSACAISLWWYQSTVFIPPVHLLLTVFCLIAYDFNREDEEWEKGWAEGGRHQ